MATPNDLASDALLDGSALSRAVQGVMIGASCGMLPA